MIRQSSSIFYFVTVLLKPHRDIKVRFEIFKNQSSLTDLRSHNTSIIKKMRLKGLSHQNESSTDRAVIALLRDLTKII